MKIKKEHYMYMKSAIQHLKDKIELHREFLIAENKAKNIEKRLRWDLANAAKLMPFFCDTLYLYLDDSHIDTALRHIMLEMKNQK